MQLIQNSWSGVLRADRTLRGTLEMLDPFLGLKRFGLASDEKQKAPKLKAGTERLMVGK